MKSKVDCINCIFNQLLRIARVSGANDKTATHILFEASKLIPQINLDLTPPEVAFPFYNLVNKITGNSNPYKDAKVEHIKKALLLYPQMLNVMKESREPLKEAIKLSIIGNSIDLGSTLDNIGIFYEFSKFKNVTFVLDDFLFLNEKIEKEQKILIIADNAGETVFDRPLIKLLISYGKKVTYAVKGSPIINDAIVDDAELSGINCDITTTGSEATGTILSYCSKNFIKNLNNHSLLLQKDRQIMKLYLIQAFLYFSYLK